MPRDEGADELEDDEFLGYVGGLVDVGLLHCLQFHKGVEFLDNGGKEQV
jgi:hypothetical protein